MDGWVCRCGAVNVSTFAYCPRCGRPADDPEVTVLGADKPEETEERSAPVERAAPDASGS